MLKHIQINNALNFIKICKSELKVKDQYVLIDIIEILLFIKKINKDDVNSSLLQKSLGKSQAKVHRSINYLKKLNFLNTHICQIDRRQRIITLTDKANIFIDLLVLNNFGKNYFEDLYSDEINDYRCLSKEFTRLNLLNASINGVNLENWKKRLKNVIKEKLIEEIETGARYIKTSQGIVTYKVLFKRLSGCTYLEALDEIQDMKPEILLKTLKPTDTKIPA